jgi:hypothetical protein
MATKVERKTVDLSGFPNLVVIYLGMRVNRMTGHQDAARLWPPRFLPPQPPSPPACSRTRPSSIPYFRRTSGCGNTGAIWNPCWHGPAPIPIGNGGNPSFNNSGGTGFWHETYFRTGGMEAIYDDIPKPVGFMRFAPVVSARGAMFGAANRAGQAPSAVPVLSEQELYDSPSA